MSIEISISISMKNYLCIPQNFNGEVTLNFIEFKNILAQIC